MKGVLLAGGTGSRLLPITTVINKHLLPVFKKPMILYPLETLIKAGIKEILIITNPQDLASFHKILGFGEGYSIKISYEVQKSPLGIADGIGLAEEFCQDEKFVCILGDNIFYKNLAPTIKKFKKQKKGAKIFLRKVKDPKPYGIAHFEGKTLIEIVEKPVSPRSDLAVVGIYLYDSHVFSIIKSIKPSNRNELEISSVNNFYVQQGEMTYEILKGPWIDAAESFENMFLASKLVRKKMQGGR